MVATNGSHGRLDFMGDELEPKLLNVMDDDESNLIVLLRDRLLGGQQQIELEVVAVGAPPREVEMHAGLHPAFGEGALGDVVVVHAKPPRGALRNAGRRDWTLSVVVKHALGSNVTP
jgi:hypothetical protein